MKYASLGTVSHGTLRDEDLISSFRDQLKELLDQQDSDDYDPEHKHMALVNEASCPFEAAFYETEAAAELINELSDALGQYSPPCCYFGSNEGNGSDFGFWWSNQDYRRRVSDGEILPINDLAELDKPNVQRLLANDDVPEYVAVISDHGNVTLYTFTLNVVTTEIVAVV